LKYILLRRAIAYYCGSFCTLNIDHSYNIVEGHPNIDSYIQNSTITHLTLDYARVWYGNPTDSVSRFLCTCQLSALKVLKLTSCTTNLEMVDCSVPWAERIRSLTPARFPSLAHVELTVLDMPENPEVKDKTYMHTFHVQSAFLPVCQARGILDMQCRVFGADEGQ
jgi:hypothetical protein